MMCGCYRARSSVGPGHDGVGARGQSAVCKAVTGGGIAADYGSVSEKIHACDGGDAGGSAENNRRALRDAGSIGGCRHHDGWRRAGETQAEIVYQVTCIWTKRSIIVGKEYVKHASDRPWGGAQIHRRRFYPGSSVARDAWNPDPTACR